MWGFVLYAIGSLICWLFPTNLVIVLIGQFIKNIGGLPCAYVFMALFADTLDHIEWKSGIRCDGIAMSIYNVIACALIGVVTGIFNGLLANAGYIAPEINELGEIITTSQPDQVKNVITFAFVGLETITGAVLAILLIFLSVEKTVGRKQAIIKARQGVEVTDEETPLNEKDSAAWEKEMAEGEAYYQKIQAELAGK
jgi:GPH family glycoside/pentoside/hexuronide:cation symporter